MTISCDLRVRDWTTRFEGCVHRVPGTGVIVELEPVAAGPGEPPAVAPSGDALRALLLEAHGYHTQVFEFVALEHTSKNKMILAVKRPHGPVADEARQQIYQQIRAIKDFYGVREHCLELLLAGSRELSPGIRR